MVSLSGCIYLAFGSDVCDDYVVDDPEDIQIGYLPAGEYVVRFMSCGMPFDPLAECKETSIPRLSFVVADKGRPRWVIPASTPASRMALVFAFAAIGLWLTRLRR